MIKVTHRKPLKKGASKIRNCGPAALSALTGRTAECIGAWLNVERGNPVHKQIGGAHEWELGRVARRLGWRIQHHDYYLRPQRKSGPVLLKGWQRGSLARYDRKADRRPTLRQWLDGDYQRDKLWAKRLIVDVGHHWVAIHQGVLADTFHPNGIQPRQSAHRNKRVREVYVLEPDHARGAKAKRAREEEPTPSKTVVEKLAKKG